MTFFNIVVPFYNVDKWIGTCIKSIKAQEYKDFRVVLINDCSTDNTISTINDIISKDDRFELIHTEKNGGALNSTCLGISHLSPKDEDVVIVLDGDDWFSRKDVLQILDKAYKDTECLMTYGSYIEWPKKERGKFSKQLPDNVIKHKLFRQSQWMTSHLRTFKFKLWNKINRKDITDENGDVYRMAGDLPVIFPMLEMAEERSHFIEDILHVYNRSNPLNEDKINHELQLSIEAEVRRKPIYPRMVESCHSESVNFFDKKKVPNYKKIWKESDSILLSNDKSGSTWLRFCIEFLSQRPTIGPIFLDKQTAVIDLPLFSQVDYKKFNGYNNKKSIVAKTHEILPIESFCSEGNKGQKLILLLRNYKELISRPDAHNDGTSRKHEQVEEKIHKLKIIDRYVEKIKFYDNFKGEKTIIFYEDLIKNFETSMKDMINFLKLGEKGLQNLELMLGDFNNFKNLSINSYKKLPHILVGALKDEKVNIFNPNKKNNIPDKIWNEKKQAFLTTSMAPGAYSAEEVGKHVFLMHPSEYYFSYKSKEIFLTNNNGPNGKKVIKANVEHLITSWESSDDQLEKKEMTLWPDELFLIMPDTAIGVNYKTQYKTHTAKSADIHHHSKKALSLPERIKVDSEVREKDPSLFKKYCIRYQEEA